MRELHTLRITRLVAAVLVTNACIYEYAIKTRGTKLHMLLQIEYSCGGTAIGHSHISASEYPGVIVYRMSIGGIQSGTLPQVNRGAAKAARTLSGNREE